MMGQYVPFHSAASTSTAPFLHNPCAENTQMLKGAAGHVAWLAGAHLIELEQPRPASQQCLANVTIRRIQIICSSPPSKQVHDPTQQGLRFVSFGLQAGGPFARQNAFQVDRGLFLTDSVSSPLAGNGVADCHLTSFSLTEETFADQVFQSEPFIVWHHADL